jgi:hypothetical protein
MLRVTQLIGFGIGSGAVIPGKVLAASGSYALTGNAAGVVKFSPANKILAGAAGAYSLTGAAAGLTYSPALTTSYANPGGTGDRTASITVSTTLSIFGSISELVNGGQGNNIWFNNNTGQTITFDFGVGASKVIDEFTWYQSVAYNQGTWAFGGSNDGSSYTEFPEAFNLTQTTQIHAVTNTAAYRYYRLRQTAGSTVSNPYQREIEFKIA